MRNGAPLRDTSFFFPTSRCQAFAPRPDRRNLPETWGPAGPRGAGTVRSVRTGEGQRETTVQSVDRAVSLLQVLARRGSAGVTEVAADVGIPKSTAFRLLSTLEARGLVDQDAERGRYRLGSTVLQLAAGATGAQDVSAASRPVCVELAGAVGETVNVVVTDGTEVTTVDQATGGSIVTSSDHVGKRGPLHATAAGKVFLAELAPDRLAAVLARGLVAFTDRTITDAQELRTELARVRSRGWALAREEHEVGLVVLAAPVRGADGEVLAALTVGGPTYRVHDDTLPALAGELLRAAARASWRLGHVKPG